MLALVTGLGSQASAFVVPPLANLTVSPRYGRGALADRATANTNLLSSSLSQGTDRESAVQSVVSFSWLVDRQLANDAVRQSLGTGKSQIGLRDVESAGPALKMKWQRRSLTMEALRQRGGPALLGLREPDRIMALAAIGAEDSLFYNAGRPEIIPNSVLAQRYAGEAIVLADASVSTPRLQVDGPVQDVEVRDDEPTQVVPVIIANRGPGPLNVGIESISCGCTAGDYNPQTLAAGEGSVLKLSVSAHSDRIVLVTLRSSDPLWPRALIALQIKKKSSDKSDPASR